MGHFYSLRHLDISIHYVTGTFLFISSPTTNSCGDKCFILVHQLHVSVINIFSGMHHLRIGSKRVNLHNSHKCLFLRQLQVCFSYAIATSQGQYQKICFKLDIRLGGYGVISGSIVSEIILK